MGIKQLIAGSALAVCAASAFATPQYNGNTEGAPATMDQAGYYIWNDIGNSASWHIRWTGIGADHSPVDWFGQIGFENSQLGTVTSFSFEGGDSLNVNYDPVFEDDFTWSAATNNTGGVDGIDFTLASFVELMEFDLGSSTFDFDTELDDPGVASNGIFIGAGKSGTNVLVKNITDAGSIQSFEIQVPEPASLALLGLGLVGLGAARRRTK